MTILPPDRHFVLHRTPMGSVYALIFCSLLLQSDGMITPQPPPSRLPAVPPTQFAPTPPTTPIQTAPIVEVPVAPAATNTRQARFTNGMSMPSRGNHVVLSATERAVLMSLTTERRDAAGNIIRDSEGNPVVVPVAKGMNVFQGQVLGKFDDRELHSILQINHAQLEVARAEREKTIELEHAAHGVQVAHAELNMMRDANSRHANTFPAMEVLRAQLVLSQAQSYLELQKYNTDEVKTREVIVRESEVERTNVQIGLRQLVSPIDGMVVGINAAEGEWLREGHDVLEIMRLDTLWVRIHANMYEYTASALYDKQATVRAILPDGRVETFQGAVFFCDPQVKVDNTFDVYIEVQNRRTGNFWLLQPGRADVEVVIQL